jgi:REP element-mobilizing transposase RayT
MNAKQKGKLPRLQREFYRGYAVVFWTLTLEQRAQGWLNALFHARFRELMLHAAGRSQLLCPAYCLMPDHLHLVWMGLRQQSDLLNAMKFLRIHLEPALGDQRQWQHQPYDRVLRPEERQRNAFGQTCAYILANPVRAQLVKNEADSSYSGAIVPGYPELNPFDTKFWPIFWKIYERERRAGEKLGAVEALKA